MASTVPSWIAIDSGSGVLSINAPEVSLDTEYDFYINSAVSGVSSPIKKLIKLIITNCAAINWIKCISTNSLTCETCLSGYVLSSGVWDISQTTNPQSPQTTNPQSPQTTNPQSPQTTNPQSSKTSSSQTSQTTSETAKALSKTTTSAVIAITGIVVFTSIMNITSIVNLWTTINQLQLYIFVILSKIYFNNFFRIFIINFNFNWLILRLIKFIINYF